MLNVKSAREIVLQHCQKMDRDSLPKETLPIWQCCQRVIAESVILDRDQPPFDRSMRDGYAVRVEDLLQVPVSLKCVGEVKAGNLSGVTLNPGETLQIMTGAPVPGGADAVLMVEHTERTSSDRVAMLRPVRAGENVAPRGSERRAGEKIFDIGRRISSFELAVLATVGKSQVSVYRPPTVAILATGDEIVGVDETPAPGQIRNSNSFSLFAQVLKLGGVPKVLQTAGDNVSDLKEKITLGLESDVLLVTGGVSMGKYDLVEPVFQELGVQVHFESVSMRPGKPTVFATRGNRWVFGLPGNPVSTFVAFELFVRPVLNALQGLTLQSLSSVRGILQAAISEKSGRTAFLPAKVINRSARLEVTPVAWKGSADIFSMVEANGFVIVPIEVSRLSPGEEVDVLMFEEIQYSDESRF